MELRGKSNRLCRRLFLFQPSTFIFEEAVPDFPDAGCIAPSLKD
jgi:hypothetical protein